MGIFCERLRELRKEKGLSQKALAEILQTTNSSVCDWEKGRSQPDLTMLAKIAGYFEVSADYLLGLENENGAKINPYFS
jgi:transcriptional regulator with XRE-family HTH domain